MRPNRHTILTATLLCCTLLSFSTTAMAEADNTNRMCPVLQDREATADYAIEYKGQEIRFCCSECVTEFQQNPEIYENAVPQLQNIPFRHQLRLFLGDYGGILISSGLLLTLVALRIRRWKNPQPQQAEGSWLQNALSRRIGPALPLAVLAGYLGYEVWSLQHQLHLQQLEDEIHYATFYDFGYPPVPRRPDTEKRVAASFYRGNDERSPKLFNEGNYRTATFHVSLCDADGKTIETGMESPDNLYVKFEIERPPFTPDFLYSPELMSTMFLTAKCDRFLEADGPLADRVNLTEVEPMQKWEALFPVDRLPSCCRADDAESLQGTVYVCQEQYEDRLLSWMGKRRSGSRFHYAIRYDLSLDSDTLTADSDVYMGALYRTRKLPTWRVPMSQWFSHEPIPELPGENVSDPKLLGVTDHVATVESKRTR